MALFILGLRFLGYMLSVYLMLKNYTDTELALLFPLISYGNVIKQEWCRARIWFQLLLNGLFKRNLCMILKGAAVDVCKKRAGLTTPEALHFVSITQKKFCLSLYIPWVLNKRHLIPFLSKPMANRFPMSRAFWTRNHGRYMGWKLNCLL